MTCRVLPGRPRGVRGREAASATPAGRGAPHPGRKQPRGTRVLGRRWRGRADGAPARRPPLPLRPAHRVPAGTVAAVRRPGRAAADGVAPSAGGGTAGPGRYGGTHRSRACSRHRRSGPRSSVRGRPDGARPTAAPGVRRGSPRGVRTAGRAGGAFTPSARWPTRVGSRTPRPRRRSVTAAPRARIAPLRRPGGPRRYGRAAPPVRATARAARRATGAAGRRHRAAAGTSARTRHGAPEPPTIGSGAATTTAPVAGSRSSRRSWVSPYLPAPRSMEWQG